MIKIKINKQKAIIVSIEILILLISIFSTFSSNATSKHDFSILSCKYTIAILLDFLLIIYLQKNVLTVQNLFLALFILFQFGLPIIYAFDESHYNYQIELLNNNILFNGLKYSAICIQIYFIFTSIFIYKGDDRQNVKNSKFNNLINNHKKDVSTAALILFIICALGAVPINGYMAYKALTATGLISNYYRGIMSKNAVTSFIYEYIFPSGLLYLCFSENKKIKRIVSFVYLLVAIELMIVADRNGGVTASVVFFLYIYFSSEEKDKKRKGRMLIVSGIIMVLLSSIIAIGRAKGFSIDSLLGNGGLILWAVEEMGFNFTSICYVMDYIPSLEGFKHGISYLAAIICLLPKSLGFRNLVLSVQNWLGETWLYNANNLYGRSYLSYGVGFSLVAESYYNYSWYGLLTFIPIAYIITKYLNSSVNDNSNKWRLYTRLVIMLGLFTLPRRQVSSLLKDIEYSIFFMAIYVILFIMIKHRKTRI